MAEKRYYKLKKGVGDHVETVDGEAKTFEAGDVVESEHDLTKTFVGKFERATRGDVRTYEAKIARLEQQKAEEAEAERRLWEQDDDEFADKQLAPPVPAKAQKAKSRKTTAEPESDETESEAGSVESELGKDVTSEFDVPDGVLVFKKGAYHYVATNDDPDTALNDTGLRADAVEEFASGY